MKKTSRDQRKNRKKRNQSYQSSNAEVVAAEVVAPVESLGDIDARVKQSILFLAAETNAAREVPDDNDSGDDDETESFADVPFRGTRRCQCLIV